MPSGHSTNGQPGTGNGDGMALADSGQRLTTAGKRCGQCGTEACRPSCYCRPRLRCLMNDRHPPGLLGGASRSLSVGLVLAFSGNGVPAETVSACR